MFKKCILIVCLFGGFFREFLLRKHEYYNPVQCLHSVFQCYLWSCVLTLLRIHPTLRCLAVDLFMKLEKWPETDVFIKSLVLDDFDKFLEVAVVDRSDLVVEFYRRLNDFASKLTDKGHLNMIGAIAAPSSSRQLSRLLKSDS